MPLFDVEWSVTEVINGRGVHDDGMRDGMKTVVASGSIQKEADSEEVIRKELSRILLETYPAHGLGSTYDIDRIHAIEIHRAQ